MPDSLHVEKQLEIVSRARFREKSIPSSQHARGATPRPATSSIVAWRIALPNVGVSR
jgi:hypothetical protein